MNNIVIRLKYVTYSLTQHVKTNMTNGFYLPKWRKFTLDHENGTGARTTNHRRTLHRIAPVILVWDFSFALLLIYLSP